MNIRKLNETISKALNEISYAMWKPATYQDLNNLDAFLNELEDDNLMSYGKVFTTDVAPDKLMLTYFPDAELFGVLEADSYGGGLIGRGKTPQQAWDTYMDVALYDDDAVYKMPKVPNRLFNELISESVSLKEDYSKLQNDKSLDKYRAILDGNEKIDGYIFQDKKHVLIKFHNVTPKDRKQVIILDDKFEERLNKAYDKCRKVNESLNAKKAMKEAIGVSDIDDLAKDYFQPYMTYNEYKNGKHNAYMVWNTDLVYISEGGAKSEIIGASSKRELKGKIAAIRTYEYEKQYGRNEQVEPPTLASTKGLFKK